MVQRKAIFSIDFKTLTVYDDEGNEFIVQPMARDFPVIPGVLWAAWSHSPKGLSSIGYGYTVQEAIEIHKLKSIQLSMV